MHVIQGCVVKSSGIQAIAKVHSIILLCLFYFIFLIVFIELNILSHSPSFLPSSRTLVFSLHVSL